MKLLDRYKKIIYSQERDRTTFMCLLMKQRNEKGTLTKEEKDELIRQIRDLSDSVPYLIVLTSPFGFLLMPLFARLLDRRKEIRNPLAKPAAVNPTCPL